MKFKVLCCLWITLMTFSSLPYATVVRIGTPFFDPPFAINDGHYIVNGFDIDLMKKICQKLNWECKFIPLEGPSLLNSLTQNKIDYAVGNLAITSDRQLKYLFSIPYMITQAGIIVLRNSSFTDMNSLKDRRVGVMGWRVYNDYVAAFNPYNVEIVPFNNVQDLGEALMSGDIDAIFLNHYTALYLVHQHGNQLRMLDIDFKLKEGIGIASNYGNEENIQKINNLILQFQTDGTFISLYDYNFAFFNK